MTNQHNNTNTRKREENPDILGAESALGTRLLIFTRWPEPGKTKTRLIPALGAEGAAQLQKCLTEKVAELAKTWRQQNPIANGVTIFYTGARKDQMKLWLGPEFNYQSQTNGDLGDRLHQGLAWALGQGSEKVAVIGTDCPFLTMEHLQVAFGALDDYPLVIGPALDGGYYLLALRQLKRAYFTDIDWGTASVYQQTLAQFEHHGQRYHVLEPLRDIDRSEDLPYLTPNFYPAVQHG